jgi:uncharacterized protein YcbX
MPIQIGEIAALYRYPVKSMAREAVKGGRTAGRPGYP